MPKLSQVVAVEKSVKSKVNSDGSALHKLTQKPELFSGFDRRYQPLNDDGERFPPESQRVQYKAEEVAREIADLMRELFDVEATKDWGNCLARADIVVDGEVVLRDVPATYLLFLEKQLDDWNKVIEEIPVLDPREEWGLDVNSSLYRTPRTLTAKTRKVQKPIVLYPATVEHPAQTQLVTEDELVGHWEKQNISGALPYPRKRALKARAEALRHAVKYAREQANSTEIEDRRVGAGLFEWLLKA